MPLKARQAPHVPIAVNLLGGLGEIPRVLHDAVVAKVHVGVPIQNVEVFHSKPSIRRRRRRDREKERKREREKEGKRKRKRKRRKRERQRE